MLTRHFSLAVKSILVMVLLASCSNKGSTGEATPIPVSSDTSAVSGGEEAQQETPTPSIPSDSTGAKTATEPQIVSVEPYIPEGPNGFIPLWKCIAPTRRPTEQNADALKDVRPDSSALADGLLDMVFMRQPPCVKNLLDGGADVNAVRMPADGFDDGPSLHLALNQRNWELADYLLKRGADPNIKTPYEGLTGGGGYTALDMAYVSFASEDMIGKIKKRGGKTARY